MYWVMNNNNFGPRPSFSVSPSTVLKQSSHLLLTSALTKKKQQQWHSYKLSLWVFIQLFSAIFWAAFKHTHFSCLHKCNHKLDSECTQQKIMTRLLSMQTADMMLRLVLRCNANHICKWGLSRCMYNKVFCSCLQIDVVHVVTMYICR